MSDGNPHGTGLTRRQLLHEMGLSSQWRLREQAVAGRAARQRSLHRQLRFWPWQSDATAAVEVFEVVEAVEAARASAGRQ
jgi:hypothetical protein